MDAIVTCGLGEQVEKLAAEYIRLKETGGSAVAVSQTWGEVHRINERVRKALKAKGFLGTTDTTVEAFDRLDLTNAQNRDERFYDPESVIVFNQKVRDAESGTKGKLAGVVKTSVLVETGVRLIAIPNTRLDRITVCVPRKIALASGDRLQLKANRKLASGACVANGESVTVKSADAKGRIELSDGRVLDESFRQFLPGYALTSYGSQGKTVDYVLFSDPTIEAATNAQQWYVTISRGRGGIRIFTPDKEQLRENVAHAGQRFAGVIVHHEPLHQRSAVAARPATRPIVSNRFRWNGTSIGILPKIPLQKLSFCVTPPNRSSVTMTAPTFSSRRASIPTADANTDAVTATPGQRMNISAFRLGWILRVDSWSKRTRRSCFGASFHRRNGNRKCSRSAA